MTDPPDKVVRAVDGPGEAERDCAAGVPAPLDNAEEALVGVAACSDRYTGRSSEDVRQQHCGSEPARVSSGQAK